MRRRSEKSEGDWEGLRELSPVPGTFFRPQAPAYPCRQQVSKQGELGGGHSGGALHPLKIIPLLLLLVCLGLRPTEWGRLTSGWGRGGRPFWGRGEHNSLPVGVGWWVGVSNPLPVPARVWKGDAWCHMHRRYLKALGLCLTWKVRLFHEVVLITSLQSEFMWLLVPCVRGKFSPQQNFLNALFKEFETPC